MRAYIETDRLILKNILPENYKEMFKWCGDPEVARYMIYPVYTNELDCKTYIESLRPDDPDICDLGIFLKESGEAIGMGGFTYHPDEDVWEVGYNLRQDMWGKGIVPEKHLKQLDTSVICRDKLKFSELNKYEFS